MVGRRSLLDDFHLVFFGSRFLIILANDVPRIALETGCKSLVGDDFILKSCTPVVPLRHQNASQVVFKLFIYNPILSPAVILGNLVDVPRRQILKLNLRINVWEHFFDTISRNGFFDELHFAFLQPTSVIFSGARVGVGKSIRQNVV